MLCYAMPAARRTSARAAGRTLREEVLRREWELQRMRAREGRVLNRGRRRRLGPTHGGAK